jgi:hypothetical protein
MEVSAAGITWFGERIERGLRRACGVRGAARSLTFAGRRAETTINMGPALGSETPARNGLVLDGFVRTA